MRFVSSPLPHTIYQQYLITSCCSSQFQSPHSSSIHPSVNSPVNLFAFRLLLTQNSKGTTNSAFHKIFKVLQTETKVEKRGRGKGLDWLNAFWFPVLLGIVYSENKYWRKSADLFSRMCNNCHMIWKVIRIRTIVYVYLNLLHLNRFLF